MAKKVFSKEVRCLTVQKHVGRATVAFVAGSKPGVPPVKADASIVVNFSDPKDAATYEPDKVYTLSIEEK